MDFLRAIDGLMDSFPGVYRLTSLSVTSQALTRWKTHLMDLRQSCQHHHQIGSYLSPFRIPTACHNWHHLVTPRTSWKHLGPAGRTLDQLITSCHTDTWVISIWLSAFGRSNFKTDDILRAKSVRTQKDVWINKRVDTEETIFFLNKIRVGH